MVNTFCTGKRALKNAGIHSLNDLSSYTENELMQLHGMGKTSIPKLQSILMAAKLNFKK